MKPATQIAVAALLACAFQVLTAVAWAGETLAVHAAFSPDRPGASTNLSIAASFLAGTGGAPPPITKFTLYAPAGMEVDLHGTGTCGASALRQKGPGACPASSRAGFGGGVAVLELPNETIHAPYTLDFFFAAEERGRLRLLVYARAVRPVNVELVLVAKQIIAPRPYGLGFSVEVPPISTFPGASNASLQSAFVTIGGPGIAYYEPVHGRRTLVRLRGMVVPKRCPSGGFPTAGTVDFADGTTLTVNPTIPCPHS